MATKGRTIEVDYLDKEAEKDADVFHRCLRICIQHQRPRAASHDVGLFCGFEGTIFFSVLTRKGRFATRHIFEASADLRKRVIPSAKGDDDRPYARAECEQILLSGPHISFMSPSTRRHACQSDNHDRYQKSFLILPNSYNVAASWAASSGRLGGQDER
jgi:hypothetical protein